MPLFGGFCPWPRRFGGGVPRLQRVFESLANSRGSAYDQTTNSAVGCEVMADARAITFEGYERAQKVANEFLPTKCTALGLLPRWEAIFQTPPMPGDTDVARRVRVTLAWMRLAQGNWVQAVNDALTLTMGPMFLGLIFQSPTTATAYWPGGATLAGYPWYSTLLMVNVQMAAPSGIYANLSDGSPNALWWQAAGAVSKTLDPLIPAWSTYQFWINSSHGGAGFYLDEADLDLEIFDV